jgi:hypothetical protein
MGQNCHQRSIKVTASHADDQGRADFPFHAEVKQTSPLAGVILFGSGRAKSSSVA